MYREYERSLNATELAEVQRLATNTELTASWWSTLKWAAIWLAGFIGFGAMGVAAAVWSETSTLGMVLFAVTFLAWVFCLACFCIVFTDHFRMARDDRRYQRDMRPRAEAALRDGMVSVKEVEATAVVYIEPFEDEGAGYIFDVGDGKLLFLKGQEYEYCENDAAWPNTRFSITRTGTEDLFLGMFGHGQPLEPVLQMQSENCHDDVAWGPDREDLIEGKLLEFCQSLKSPESQGEP